MLQKSESYNIFNSVLMAGINEIIMHKLNDLCNTKPHGMQLEMNACSASVQCATSQLNVKYKSFCIALPFWCACLKSKCVYDQIFASTNTKNFSKCGALKIHFLHSL